MIGYHVVGSRDEEAVSPLVLYSDDHVIANYHDYGFDGSIPKPFNVDTLARALARLVPKSRLQMHVYVITAFTLVL